MLYRGKVPSLKKTVERKKTATLHQADGITFQDAKVALASEPLGTLLP
jgi:hypothetical protein